MHWKELEYKGEGRRLQSASNVVLVALVVLANHASNWRMRLCHKENSWRAHCLLIDVAQLEYFTVKWTVTVKMVKVTNCVGQWAMGEVRRLASTYLDWSASSIWGNSTIYLWDSSKPEMYLPTYIKQAKRRPLIRATPSRKLHPCNTHISIICLYCSRHISLLKHIHPPYP